MKFAKKEVVIAVIFLLIGIVLSYLYYQTKLKEYKRVGFKIMDNCIQTVKAADDLTKNCGQAYKIVGSCVSNLNTCDILSEANKLEALNKQKAKIEEDIKKLTEESGSLIEVVNRTKSQ